jgi:phospholipid/cholesterol/gamma-HCH transport system ATP-binding protein
MKTAPEGKITNEERSGAQSGEEPRRQIAVRNLHKSIGTQHILRGVDFHVRQGQTYMIIGRSGGGKSVLLKNLIGLMRADEGSIRICGTEIVGLRERRLSRIRQQVGILFQGAALFDSLTVYENIAFPLREAGEKDEEVIRGKIEEALELLGLSGHGEKLPVALSGGMRKRVGLARAIITQPRCVLYDEPTAGLDPVVSDSINRLINRLQNRLGMTSIVVTHDMRSVDDAADYVGFLREGTMYWQGTVPELHACEDRLVRNFVEGRGGDEGEDDDEGEGED